MEDNLCQDIHAIRECSLILLDQAGYILDELPAVQVNEILRHDIYNACQRIIATRHDIISELADVDDMPGSGEGEADIQSILDRCLNWLREDLDQMHQVVIQLQNATEHDPALSAVYLLVAESTTNMLNAYREFLLQRSALRQRSRHSAS